MFSRWYGFSTTLWVWKLSKERHLPLRSAKNLPLLKKLAERIQSIRNFEFCIKIKVLNICYSCFNFAYIAGRQISREIGVDENGIEVYNKRNKRYFSYERTFVLSYCLMVLEIDDALYQNCVDLSEYLNNYCYKDSWPLLNHCLRVPWLIEISLKYKD